jgi:hypothetical protein
MLIADGGSDGHYGGWYRHAQAFKSTVMQPENGYAGKPA